MKVPSNTQKGFTLLFSVIIASIVLAIGVTILNITLKQFLLSGISRGSEMAFHAANAGVECLSYWDRSGVNGDTFDLPGDGTGISDPITPDALGCFGETLDSGRLLTEENGHAFQYEVSWGEVGSELCSQFEIWKYFEQPGTDGDDVGPDMGRSGIEEECPEGAECTIVFSRGYNRQCADVRTGLRNVIERELVLIY